MDYRYGSHTVYNIEYQYLLNNWGGRLRRVPRCAQVKVLGLHLNQTG
jgi:hypothetical protein